MSYPCQLCMAVIDCLLQSRSAHIHFTSAKCSAGLGRETPPMQRFGHEMLGRSCGPTCLRAKNYSGSLPDHSARPECIAWTPAWLEAE